MVTSTRFDCNVITSSAYKMNLHTSLRVSSPGNGAIFFDNQYLHTDGNILAKLQQLMDKKQLVPTIKYYIFWPFDIGDIFIYISSVNFVLAVVETFTTPLNSFITNELISYGVSSLMDWLSSPKTLKTIFPVASAKKQPRFSFQFVND